MDDLEKGLTRTKGTRVWIGFAWNQARDFDHEKGVVYLSRRQAPFDDAREFILKPVKDMPRRERR